MGGSVWQDNHVSTKFLPLDNATPRWQNPLVRHKSHPAIPLNQLDPAKQVIFLEKFSLLNPVQQAFAYNQFFSTTQDVQTFAINQFIKLDADALVWSVQAELEKAAESNPDEVKHIFDGAQPELKLSSAVVVKLPIGRVCRDHQWIDGWGMRTLYRDCETGVVYNININVNFNFGNSTTDLPDVKDPVTTGTDVVPTTTTEASSEDNCEEATENTRECDKQITDCSGDGCVEVSGDGSDSDEM